MSTRSGDLDPGLVWYLARTKNVTAKKFNEMVNFQSGLLGISETSSDMQDLLEREAKDIRAAEAVALFCYQVKKWIGAFAAALGGLDTLVFSGGIGERFVVVQARVYECLSALGIELDFTRNSVNAAIISKSGSPVQVGDGWVIPDRRIWGTYLHGLFDRDEFRRDFLSEITRACCREGSAAPTRSFRDFQEAQLDRLADLLRTHLDLARIRALIQP